MTFPRRWKLKRLIEDFVRLAGDLLGLILIVATLWGALLIVYALTAVPL